MKNLKYQDTHSGTTACVLRLLDGSAYSGQLLEERIVAKESQQKRHVSGDSWFASVATAEECSMRNIEFFGVVRT